MAAERSIGADLAMSVTSWNGGIAMGLLQRLQAASVVRCQRPAANDEGPELISKLARMLRQKGPHSIRHGLLPAGLTCLHVNRSQSAFHNLSPWMSVRGSTSWTVMSDGRRGK